MSDIGPERWHRIAEIFEHAIELAPGEREEFLREACMNDPPLREHVERLIAADAAANRFLTGAAAERIAPLVREVDEVVPPAGAPAGRRIGAYRLIEEIGRGGMGVVYLAERVDGQFEERVCLKLLKRGLDSEEILRRFRQERQILAWLRHPNIASLLDGGLTDDGLPYLVMEYVKE